MKDIIEALSITTVIIACLFFLNSCGELINNGAAISHCAELLKIHPEANCKQLTGELK